VDIL
jgi:hypothetical protein